MVSLESVYEAGHGIESFAATITTQDKGIDKKPVA